MQISKFTPLIFLLFLTLTQSLHIHHTTHHLQPQSESNSNSEYKQDQTQFEWTWWQIPRIVNDKLAQFRKAQGMPARGSGQGLMDNGNRSAVEDLIGYSAKFRKFGFGLDEDQLRGLAFNVSQLYGKDRMAMFFVQGYFVRAIQKLQQKNLSSLQITNIIKDKATKLMDMTSSQTYQKQKHQKSPSPDLGPESWKQIENSVTPLTRLEFKFNSSSPQDKDEQIQEIIMKVVEKAKSYLQDYDELVKTVCLGNGAISYSTNLKIKEKSQRPQMRRIKEKLIRYLMKPPSSYIHIGREEEELKDYVNQVFAKTSQLKFNVTDILRARCRFPSVSQIHATTLSLLSTPKTKFQSLPVRLVQFANRLEYVTSDVSLLLQINDLPCQLQLALDFDQSLAGVNHRMYELVRSNFFSPVGLLFEDFQVSAPEFMFRVASALKEKGELRRMGGNPRQMAKEYVQLNKLFGLKAYKINNMSEQEFKRQKKQEIQKEIIEPFTQI